MNAIPDKIIQLQQKRQLKVSEPIPLIKTSHVANLFPVKSLPAVIKDAVLAICDLVQCPIEIAAQSVLASITLATQAHANVMLPTGSVRPLSSLFITIADSGERKSSCDNIAMKAFVSIEDNLRRQFEIDNLNYQNKKMAWDSAKLKIIKNNKKSHNQIAQELDTLGPEPKPPLIPILRCEEPTFEGLYKLFQNGQPSIGLFSAEGGQFISGHAMSKDSRMKTVTALSNLWDGVSLTRVRAGDGASSLHGRRLSSHLMMQPNLAINLLNDEDLLGQGFLSRLLVSSPQSTSGTRLWREPNPSSLQKLEEFYKKTQDLYDLPLPLKSNTLNELQPRTIELSDDAKDLWKEFHDTVELKLSDKGEYSRIKGFANKMPEHATRLACVMGLFLNPTITVLDRDILQMGIDIVNYYANEANRLYMSGKTNPSLVKAQRVLDWMHQNWKEDLISLPDIYGNLSIVSSKDDAKKIVSILEEFQWLHKVDGKHTIKGKPRIDVWAIVKIANSAP